MQFYLFGTITCIKLSPNLSTLTPRPLDLPMWPSPPASFTFTYCHPPLLLHIVGMELVWAYQMFSTNGLGGEWVQYGLS